MARQEHFEQENFEDEAESSSARLQAGEQEETVQSALIPPGAEYRGKDGEPTPAGVNGSLPESSQSAPLPPPAPGGWGVFRKRPIFLDFDLLQLAGIFFLLDQLTKFLVLSYLPLGYSYPPTGLFRLTHAQNTGSAFGILQGQNTPLIVASVVGIIVLSLIYHSQPRITNLLRLSLSLQIGGALGNLVDRLRLGAVTDFIDVGIWPIFNLADASIVTGMALLGWIFIRPGGRGTATAPRKRAYSLRRRGRCLQCRRLRSGRLGGRQAPIYCYPRRRASRRGPYR